VKLNIFFNFKDSAFGGGNQFLKTLRHKLNTLYLYEEDPKNSDVIIFNSHQQYQEIFKLKRVLLNTKFIHRVDGPMRLYNNMSDTRDDIVYKLNRLSDGTIFQSKYSFENNINLGMKVPDKYAIIQNFCDDNIFKTKTSVGINPKIRIISTSFSTNIKKGFETYKFLDDNLDFSKYEYIFVGNSPVQFNNITNIGCLTTQEIAKELYKSDIYFTASQNDPCSNSLIEAQTVGLPTIALNSGGHPEIINNNAELYESKDDLLEKINNVSDNIQDYFLKRSKINSDTITEKYIQFARSL
jgi:glycosyltransferase involved in cell wall biosynthesis